MASTEYGRAPTEAELMPIERAYAWAKRRAMENFWADAVAVTHALFDFGNSYVLGFTVGNRRIAIKLEYSWITNFEEGELYWDDEIKQWSRYPPPGGWQYGHYSLNALPDREAILDRRLVEIRQRLTAEGKAPDAP